MTSSPPEKGRGEDAAASPSRYRTIVADPPWDHSDGTGFNYGAQRCDQRRFGFLWRLHRWEEAGWGCMRCRDCGAMR